MDPITQTEALHKVEFEKYGAIWPTDDEIWIERQLIRLGGYIKVGGSKLGNGMLFHVKQLQQLLWPDKVWHRWNDLILSEVLKHRVSGIMGPASSGKTHEAACLGLVTYFCWPVGCTVLVSSTDVRSLELRIWGEIKKYWAKAKEIWPDCPGHLIESRQVILTSDDTSTGRDFRNGIIGIPCVVGGQYVGLGKYVGVKNTHMLLLADEASFMGKAFVDSVSNLNKNKGFKMLAMGNPKDPDDCLGLICEPSQDIGGYDGVDQGGKTRTWPTRWNKGICIQLVGTDSPNYDVEEGQKEPYPFLIGREEIKSDLLYYGQDSLQFSMMNLGVMPRGAQARRIITRQLVENCGGFDKAIWQGTDTVLVAGLDAAYSASGGDRTAMILLRVGKDEKGVWQMAMELPHILLTPKARSSVTVEDQIATQIKKICEDHSIPPHRFYYDSTGRGSLASALARTWSANCVGVEFGGRPSDRIVSDVVRVPAREHFTKFVSELWFFTRYVVEAKQIKQLTEELVKDGTAREWTITKGNLVDVEPKSSTKKRMGRSPDIYDAFVVAVEGARRNGFQVTKLANLDDDDRYEAEAHYRDLMYKKRSLMKQSALNFSA